MARSAARAEGARGCDARLHTSSAARAVSFTPQPASGDRRVPARHRPGGRSPRLPLRHLQNPTVCFQSPHHRDRGTIALRVETPAGKTSRSRSSSLSRTEGCHLSRTASRIPHPVRWHQVVGKSLIPATRPGIPNTRNPCPLSFATGASGSELRTRHALDTDETNAANVGSGWQGFIEGIQSEG